MKPDAKLFDRRILLVEDEYFQAIELRNELVDRGAAVIGPLGSLDEAEAIVTPETRPDAAVVDINLRGELAISLIDKLVQLDVEIMIVTGYERDVLPFRHQHIPQYVKPIAPQKVADVLGAMLVEHGRDH